MKKKLAVTGQLTFSPMRFLARRIGHALNVAVQRPHDADARKHRWSAVRRDQDKGLHCRLPLLRRVLRLRKLCDVGASVFEGDELATLGQRDWVSELPRPTGFNGAWRCHRPLQNRLAALADRRYCIGDMAFQHRCIDDTATALADGSRKSKTRLGSVRTSFRTGLAF
jgi:hypothetical protein